MHVLTRSRAASALSFLESALQPPRARSSGLKCGVSRRLHLSTGLRTPDRRFQKHTYWGSIATVKLRAVLSG